MNDIRLYEDISELKSTFPIKVRKYHDRLIPAHWHEHIELLYLLSGQATFVCNAKPVTARAGESVVINSGELHYLAGDTDVEYICIILDCSLLSDAGCENVVLQSHIPSDPTVTDYVTRIFQSYTDRQSFSDLAIKGAVCLLMAHLIDRYAGEPLPPNEYDLRRARMKKMNALLNYIHENYSQHLTTASLAEEHHFSESHLCRLFKATSGTTVTEYINRFRIDKATVLLKNTDESVSQIAKNVGFDNLNYFDRVFKKEVGCSPIEYRSRNARSDGQ